MGTIGDTLQTLERVMEYKKTSADLCMEAARTAEGARRKTLVDMAVAHDAHVRQIPVIFKHLQFSSSLRGDETPLTEMRSNIFADVTSPAGGVDLVGAVVRVEQEALRLLRKPLERAGSTDLRAFLQEVVDTAQSNIERLETLRREGQEIP